MGEIRIVRSSLIVILGLDPRIIARPRYLNFEPTVVDRQMLGSILSMTVRSVEELHYARQITCSGMGPVGSHRIVSPLAMLRPVMHKMKPQ